ncbi:hypothetical protein SMICM17S_01124 [Streptomyces microflavus]
MEYRHGPISVSTSGTATWMFGAAPEGLAEQVPPTGAQWVESGPTRWPTSYAYSGWRSPVRRRRGSTRTHPAT